MERLRETLNLIAVFLLAIVNLAALSSCQNLNTTFATFTIDVGSTSSADQHANYSWSQPPNTTISISQETTTYLPAPSTDQTQEILDSAETGFPNRYQELPYYNEEKDDDFEEPADHVIPYSVHEDARDVPTRPEHVAPGLWAKPPPDKDIPLDFVPTKLHAQVRGTHTVKRLPQQEAIENAETDEEKHNAHRLREVVTNSKANTVYTEEGYEDSAYDHAGHIRDADFHEGFARKLHDRKNDKQGSRSGKRKKGEHGKLVPNEYKEYDEDYQDHLEENRKREKISDDEHNLIEYGKNAWQGSEIDPKLVIVNGVQELEKDIEEDAEEAERSERIYQRQQESRPSNEVDVNSLESEEAHDEDDLKNEGNKPVTSKKQKSKLQKKKTDTLDKETKTSRKLGQKKRFREESHETTVLPAEDGRSSEVDPETPASLHGFVKNPLNLEVHSIDQSTLRYVTPASSVAFQQLDEPTTINYSQVLWDYFKTSQQPPTIGPIGFIPNSTTPSPRLEEHTPVAVATIDGHGPYLLVTKEETTTLPSTFFGTHSFQPQNLFSDPVPNSVGEQGLPERSDEASYIGGVDNVIDTSTVPTFSSVQPLLLQPLQTTNIEDTEYSSSTTLFDDVAPTPAVTTLNFTEEAYSRIDDYQANPFLGPIVDNSNIAVTRNKFKYRVLVRPTPKKPVKPTAPPQPLYQQTPSSTTLQEDNGSKRTREDLSAKYTKILDYIKSKQKIKPLAGSKITFSGDLSLMKPPVPHQRAVYSSFPTSYPIAEHSGVAFESEANNWRGASRDQHRSQPTDPSYPLNPLVFAHPAQLTYRKNLLPVTKLLPPPPLPLPPPIAGTYVTYHSGSQHNDYLSHVLGRPQQQQPRDNTLKLFPLTLDASWRPRRKKRSGDDTTSETSLVIGRSDENAEEFAKKKRHVSQRERRSREDSKKNLANDENHEKLLNKSPKISGDVIDTEIATRFNETGDANETSTEDKGEGKIEVEVPSFDYVEELAEDSTMEPSTTTETHIDAKKYPFYNNKNVPVASALKYVVDPRTIPRKTSRGMVFYDSRNAYKQCDEVEADLDKVLPEKEEPDPERGPQENLPRLRGLGDKLDCFKAKYFDEDPLDNPLFAEKSVEEPKPPAELDPVKFASKVLLLPEEDDDYVVHRVSKKPERHGRQWRRRNPQYDKHNSIRVNYKHDPKTGRSRNAYLHTVRSSGLPNTAVRRTRNRQPKPKSPTSTPSPKTEYQTESYQNQVYEDVMGNIRSMVKGYQVYEVTTLPAAMQIQTAGSENAPKIAEDTPNLSTENNTDIANVTSDNAMSSEIKGLVPPPKYLTPRRLANYRKYRPLGKNRISVVRASSLPHIIAHHHAIKISKRSARAINSSEDTSDKDEKKTVEKPIIAVNGNDVAVNGTVTKTTTTTATNTNSTPATLNLKIEESRLSQEQRPLSSTLKVDDKKRRRNSTSSDITNEATPQKTVYTIRDRIRYSKPKWDTEGFGKFSASPKTADVDSRRKEPRYNHFTGKKPVTDSRINSTTLSTIDNNILTIESATSSTGDRESSTTEIHRPEDSVAHQSAYSRKVEYPEVEVAESVNDVKSEESSEEEDDEEEDDEEEDDEKDEDEVEKEEKQEEEKETEETENTTENTYRVHENVDENIPATTTKLPSTFDSKEILNFQKYFETDPPGYAETFPQEKRLSNKSLVSMKNKSEDSDEKKDQDHSKNIAASSEDDSLEKSEEQVEVPIKTGKEKKNDDDSSEESSSKEEEGSKNDQTFFTYTTRPSWVEDYKDNKPFEKTLYRPFPFKRYKSMIKKEQSNEDEDSEEESEEVNEDAVFPWQGDKESDTSRKLKDVDRYEYPWEKRERLAKEQRERRQRAKRFKKLILDDEDEDEDEDEEEEEKESRRRERPLYPWDKYKIPSKSHVNTRRDVSSQNMDDSEEESSREELTLKKFSSKYNADVRPTIRPSSAREIGKSIKKFLEDDFDESQEETSKEKTSMEETSKEVKDHSASSTQVWPATSRGISRGTLVPEDVTQPPRRKSGRRRTSHYDKDITSSSRFDSTKKLRSKETDDEEGEEKEGLVKDYLKLSKSKSEESGSQTAAASSQLFNITKEASSTTSAPRKKRRRVIPKNSTISFDNALVESSTVSVIASSTEATKRRRRKPRVSTTTSAAPPASDDLKTSKSDFTHLRRRYSTAADIVKMDRPNSTEEISNSTAGTVKADSVEAEASTPKTRTIEHQSRVSKEKIVTKTTYPDEAENFDVARRNATSALQEPLKKVKIKVNRRKSNGKRRNDNGSSAVNEKPKKRKDQGEYHDIRLKEDDIGRSVTSEEAGVKRDGNPLKGLGMRKEEVKKINNISSFDGIVNNKDDDFGDAMPSEVSSSPQHRTAQLTQYSSKQTVSSLSWVSNNYDYD